MKVSKIPGLGRFGIFVDDLDFDHITDEEWMEVGQLHMKNLVTIIRNTNIGPDRFPDYIRKFGDFRHGFIARLMKKYGFEQQRQLWQAVDDPNTVLDAEDLQILTFAKKSVNTNNKGQFITRVQTGYDDDGYPKGWFPDGELNWHNNESGVLSSVPGVALLGYQNMVGSATGFLTTTDYYESVSESFRSELDEFIIVHKYCVDSTLAGLSSRINHEILELMAVPVDESEVPLIRKSPGGIFGLHYSPATTWAIKGMTKEQSDRVFEEINRGLYQEKYIYNHWYQQNNDLLLFDNSVTLHQRIGKTDGRLAYRLAHDYTNLQNGFHQPYEKHPRIARQYISEINETIKIAGITNFKLPGFRDYVKTFF